MSSDPEKPRPPKPTDPPPAMPIMPDPMPGVDMPETMPKHKK